MVPELTYEKTVRSDEYLIQAPQIEVLENGFPVPNEVWEPIFGKQEFLDLLTELLKEDGDFVVARGSSVQNAIFGGYKIDPKTGKAIPGQITDFDFAVPSLIETRESVILTSGSKGRYANRTSIETAAETLRVEFISMSSLEDRYKKSLEALKLLLLDRSSDSSVESLVEHIQAILTSDWQNPADYLKYSGFTLQDSAGFVFTKEAGEVKVYFADPQNSVKACTLVRVKDPAIPEADINPPNEIHAGVTFDGINEHSAQANFLRALPYFKYIAPKDLGLDPWVAYVMSTTSARVIRAACELDIFIMGGADISADARLEMFSNREHFQNTPYIQYVLMYELAQQVNAQQRSRFFEEALASGGKITKAIQEDIARSAFQKPVVAAQYMYGYLPSGSFFIPELDRQFSPDINTLLPQMFRFRHIGLENDVHDIMDSAVVTCEQAEQKLHATSVFLNHLSFVYAKYYGTRDTHTSDAAIYENYNRAPSSMSELTALYLVAAGLPDDALDKAIEETVNKWQLRGQIQMPWAKTEMVDFDIGITTEEVKSAYAKIKQVYDEEQSRYTASVTSIAP